MTAPAQPVQGAEKPYWSVTVKIDGEEVLTIEPHMLAGIPDIDKYADEIRTAGQHLVSFAGPEGYEDNFLADVFEDERRAAFATQADATKGDA